MALPKKYFHDHFVLLLLSVNAFLAVAGSIFMFLRLSTGHGTTYIVQCRDCSNPNYIDKYTTGGIMDLLGIVAFAVLVLLVSTLLSTRAYKIHRQLAIIILSLSILLEVLAVMVGYFLIGLR